MAQPHLVIKSFKDRQAATPELVTALPGGLRHGTKADTTTPRPFGLITCEEKDRKYHSGGAAFVSYEVVLTIVGTDRVETVGHAQDLFAAVFNMSRVLPSVDGYVIIIEPAGSTIIEDPNNEYGKDILIGRQTWNVLIQESELILT